MNKFIVEKGVVLPLDRANVDTDFIIPKQFLKSIKRTGFGVNLFDEHRYLDKGLPDTDNSQRPINPDFVLNQSRYKDAKVLLAKDNFGCGSSREHAPWALDDYGFRAILAPSYADIFFNNCFKNGLLPIVLDKATISALFTEVEANQGYQLEVDLEQQIIIKPDGSTIEFSVDAFRKNCLLNGLDDIGLTLEESETIRNFEESWRSTAPWYFTTSNATTT
ncbi:MAG: 3-isopropylmalate dehydratase small subunit [Gammaproteobacteria bacterium]|jgi:3-isopropylmalate/(R)-2-methylmalate dehydratase small subunit|tara:strand:+ start:298 stop:957 length:660 start_codon:yes stop_codon:yes gene_type:complete